jgi:cytochrome d ubiquinol oxidase subunit I
MQHPVGYVVNEAAGRAELKDFPAVLLNSTALATFPHTIAAGLFTAGVFVMAVSAYHVKKANDVDVFRPSIRLGMAVTLVALIAVMVTGDIQARVMTKQQPMKMAAAEALYNSKSSAGFSIFTIGSLDGSQEVFSIRVPKLLSIMATGKPSGTVEGINDLQTTEAKKYGAGDYSPNIPVAYWSFRLMIGFGVLAGLIAAWGLWLFRRGRTPTAKWFYRGAMLAVATPYLANSFGWIFTEMARQPWAVFGVLKTADGVSVTVGAATVATSLIGLGVLYGVLAVIEIGLMVRYIKAGAPAEPEPGDDTPAEDRPLTFAY